MIEDEHFLLCLAEECDEVGQRVMKALRFGLYEIQPGQPFTNATRIQHELHDLIAVARILEARGLLGEVIPPPETIGHKLRKIERFMQIGRDNGALSEDQL